MWNKKTVTHLTWEDVIPTGPAGDDHVIRR